MIFGENLESNGVEDEAERLVKEINMMVNNVELSEFYAEMHKDLKDNQIIQQEFRPIIDSHLRVQVVIYGLGSIGYSFNSQFHLAVVLLLKRDFSSWIGDIEIHGTAMSSADIAASQKLGLKLFTIDENCKRKAQSPTMFFMPNPRCQIIGNILGENWSCLNKILLLTFSLKGVFQEMYIDDRNNLETMLRLQKILEFTEEIAIKTGNDERYGNVFSGYAWHFFPVDTIIEIDMDKLEHCSLLRQRYLKSRKSSDTPSDQMDMESDANDPEKLTSDQMDMESDADDPEKLTRDQMDMESDADDPEKLIEEIKQDVNSDAEKLIEDIKHTLKFVETSEGDQTSDDMESNADFHIGDHVEKLVEKLVERIKRTMKYVAAHEFYVRMQKDLKENKTIKKHISRVLGSYSHVEVVIYGLGSVEYFYNSRLQLAMVLQLQEDFPDWIGNIEIYDPIMSSVDIAICKKLGLEVLTINEDCKRTAQRPTMFYMPAPYHLLIGNLLGANWSSSCLNRILLLTDSLHELFDMLLLEDPVNLETGIRLQKILKFTTEFDIELSEKEKKLDVEFAWHFFDVDNSFDTNINKPGYYCFDMQRYLETKLLRMQSGAADETFAEYLSFYRNHVSVPLSPGWSKLNIYGISRKGNQQGKFCGVFRDKDGFCFRRYVYDTDVQDEVIAGLEALTCGLKIFKKEKQHGAKLIVESDNVMLFSMLMVALSQIT